MHCDCTHITLPRSHLSVICQQHSRIQSSNVCANGYVAVYRRSMGGLHTVKACPKSSAFSGYHVNIYESRGAVDGTVAVQYRVLKLARQDSVQSTAVRLRFSPTRHLAVGANEKYR
jgi:hypothetical protein